MIFWICLSSTLLITVTAARLLTHTNTYSHTSIHTNAFTQIHIHKHIHIRTFTHVHIKALIRHSNYRQTQYDLSRTHSQILTNGQIQIHTAGRHTETADTHKQQTDTDSR